jgi:hypothetical protein
MLVWPVVLVLVLVLLLVLVLVVLVGVLFLVCNPVPGVVGVAAAVRSSTPCVAPTSPFTPSRAALPVSLHSNGTSQHITCHRTGGTTSPTTLSIHHTNCSTCLHDASHFSSSRIVSRIFASGYNSIS